MSPQCKFFVRDGFKCGEPCAIKSIESYIGKVRVKQLRRLVHIDKPPPGKRNKWRKVLKHRITHHDYCYLHQKVAQGLVTDLCRN